MLYTSRCKQ